MRGKIATDLSGETFRTWLVVSRNLEYEEELKLTGRNKLAQYYCRCSECGNVRTYSSEQIRRGSGAWCECQGSGKRVYTNRSMSYGCPVCADKKKCSGNCKYRAIFEKYGGYAKFDIAAVENLYAVVAAFPKNI
jgi:hypothetical protein